MSYFTTTERDSSVAMYRDTEVSRYTNPKYLNNQLPSYFITSDLEIYGSRYLDTLYQFYHLLSDFITGYLNSYISRYTATKELQCPNA
ncbi:MAG TPA: hypothetical protein VGI43_14275, partial [Mucilaginibacter sp.]